MIVIIEIINKSVGQIKLSAHVYMY